MASLYVLVYSFAMKYVALLTIIVLMVRIDVLLRYYDEFTGKSAPVPEVSLSDIDSNREIIPIAQDKNFKQSPREDFLALLADFRVNPEKAVRERAMLFFKDHPTIFTQKLDRDLEGTIYRWRDLLINNEPEVTPFLLDLLNILQGENQEMIKRFFSLWMEIDMENFLKAYSQSRDTNCTIATTFGDNLPENEKLNEIIERQDALKAFVLKERIDPKEKSLASNCLLVISIYLQKNAPPVAPPEATSITIPSDEESP